MQRMALNRRPDWQRFLITGVLLGAGWASAEAAALGATNHVWHHVGASASYIRGTPAFGDDGTIYIGSGDRNLYAFNPDGTTNHLWTTGSSIIGSPVIGSNGTIYIGANDSKLWAFNPDGTTNGSWTLGGDIYGTPAIGADGTIYIGDLSHKFYALNPAGFGTSHVWNVGSDFRGHPAIGADGTIYVGNDDHNLYAFNPDGTTNHVWSLSGQIYHGPAISSNGTMYIGDQAGYFWAFNPDGTTNYVWKLSDMVYHSSAAIGPDSRIYVGSFSTLTTHAYGYGLNPDGTTNRTWWLSSRYSMNSPAVDQHGTIYIGSASTLFALNPTNGVTNATWHLGADIMSSVAIGPDNNIYVGCEDGTFYSLAGVAPLANTCWPKAHQNLKNTGLVFYAPKNVAATDGAYSNRVLILWDSVPQALGYQIYRSTTNTTNTLLGSSTSNGYADVTATAGVTYYYWIQATNAVFTSPFSDVVTGSRAGGPLPPRAPFGVSASDGTFTNKIRVSWTGVSNAYAYEVLRSPFPGTGTASRVGASMSTGYNDTAASAGTTYYYWVQAVNAAGTSRVSLSDSGTRAAAVSAPAAPQNLTASDGAYSDRILLTWSVVSNASTYKVYRNTTSNSDSATWVADATTPSAADTTVTADTLYYYWIKGYNDGGSGAFSSPDSGYATAPESAPAAPGAVTASKGTYTDRVRITWNVISNASTYEVYRYTNDTSASATKLEPDASSASFDDSTADLDTNYYYWVKARNSVGTSDFSGSDYGYLVVSVVTPIAPSGLAASKATYTDRVRITWTAVSNASAYEVYRYTNDTFASASKLDPDATSASFDDSSALPGQTYDYWVKAKNAAGASSVSTSDYGVAAMPVPGNVLATKGLYTDRVQVTWTAVAGSPIYEVYRHTTNDVGSAVKINPESSTNTFDDTSVTLNVAYYYWVKSKYNTYTSEYSACDQGYSTSSVPTPTPTATPFAPPTSTPTATLTATPTPTTAPTGTATPGTPTPTPTLTATPVATLPAPAGVTASAGSYTDRIRIAWNAVPGSTSYQVWRHIASDSAGASLLGSAAAVLYDDLNATPGTPYYYWVKAAAGAGVSPFSTAATGWRRSAMASDTGFCDFDGDELADLGLYQESTGYWCVSLSSGGYGAAVSTFFGGPGFRPMPADYDGDGKTDPAVYAETLGRWVVMMSGSGYATASTALGETGWQPIAMDYDGDAKADPAIHHSLSGTWMVMISGSGYAVASAIFAPGSNPIPSDADGDGKADPLAYNATTGTWNALLSRSGYSTASAVFGDASYRSLVMDYDGDGKADPTLYSEALGRWVCILSGSGYAQTVISLGGAGFEAVSGDYDGDRKSDPAVYQRNSGIWTILRSGQSYAPWTLSFGGAGLEPVQALR